MTYAYCREWLRNRRRPLEVLDIREAQACHDLRRPYTVLAPNGGQPAATVELTGPRVVVRLLDRQGREYLRCAYHERSPARLFLAKATYLEFRGKSAAVELWETYRFKDTGSVAFRKYHFTKGMVDAGTIDVDVSANWDRYPVFGSYDSILALPWVERLQAI